MRRGSLALAGQAPHSPRLPDRTSSVSLSSPGREWPPATPSGCQPVDRIQIALATDMHFLRPTLVAMMSAIAHASRPVSVCLCGIDLSEHARKVIDAACGLFPGTKLAFHDISERIAEIPFDGPLPKSAAGALLIPGLASGRILYLDSDTITCGDISPLFDLDLKGTPIAAVRDYTILNDIRKNVAVEQEYFHVVERLMKPHPPIDNVNSGVVLMDCEKIRDDGEIEDGMVGRAKMEVYGVEDQHILNATFKGRVTFLGPEWNCLWGRMLQGRRISKAVLPSDARPNWARPRIIHFKDGVKPWDVEVGAHARLSKWMRLVALAYRLRARSLLRPLERLHGGF